MSQSAVYKLVHEIEDKTRANEKEKESAYYNTPVSRATIHITITESIFTLSMKNSWHFKAYK